MLLAKLPGVPVIVVPDVAVMALAAATIGSISLGNKNRRGWRFRLAQTARGIMLGADFS